MREEYLEAEDVFIFIQRYSLGTGFNAWSQAANVQHLLSDERDLVQKLVFINSDFDGCDASRERNPVEKAIHIR